MNCFLLFAGAIPVCSVLFAEQNELNGKAGLTIIIHRVMAMLRVMLSRTLNQGSHESSEVGPSRAVNSNTHRDRDVTGVSHIGWATARCRGEHC